MIVCDGRKAFILQNEGDDKFINLRSREVYEHTDPPTRRPGHRYARARAPFRGHGPQRNGANGLA